MKIKSLVFPFCLMNCCIVNAQIDSLNVMVDDTHLEELVITSQIEPQSLKKAINNVRVISKEDIQNLLFKCEKILEVNEIKLKRM